MKARTSLALCAVILATSACEKRPGTQGEIKPTDHPNVSELKKSECKDLGGSVVAAPVCGDIKLKCVTVTINPVTNQQEPHERCIDEADS